MNGATANVLLVDDEPLVLDGIQRQHGRRFTFKCARSGAAALELVRDAGPFAAVVSDYNMPGMNGVEFLSRMREVSPESVRIMLTGQADVHLAIDAVNRGAISRFLTKPCDASEFAVVLHAALEQYRLQKVERELLEQTLAGCVQVLTDILALVSPDAFGRAVRARDLARAVAGKLCPEHAWTVETAALLSQIGLVAVPASVLETVQRGGTLSKSERSALQQAPATAAMLIGRVPRMGPVAEMIRLQAHRFDGAGGGEDPVGDQIPLGARILCAALALEELVRRGKDPSTAVRELRERRGEFDPIVLDAFAGAQTGIAALQRFTLPARRLQVGMVLDQDVLNHAGAVVVPRGYEITVAILARLHSHIDLGMVQEPIRVLRGAPPREFVPPTAPSLAPASDSRNPP